MKFDDFKPMLTCPVDIDNVGKYLRYTMEVKLDGVRCIAIKDSTGYVRMYTRSGKELHHKLDHIANQLQCIPGMWVLDGELGYVMSTFAIGATTPTAIDFNATMRVIGSDPVEARRKQQVNIAHGLGPIKFIVFDVLQVGNYRINTVIQKLRRDQLETLLERGTDLYDVILSYQWPRWDETIYNNIVQSGGEGVMLKNPEAPYHIGKRRANSWYKVKAYDTFDGVIVGWDPGKGKYEGAIGALVIQDSTGTCVHVSGMNDNDRQHMTDNFERLYHNRHVEVKHFGRVGESKDGYRHPQYLRMRPDLD